MYRLRKYFAALAITAVAVIGLGGGISSASAANCTPGVFTGTHTTDGDRNGLEDGGAGNYIYYTPRFTVCSDVEAVDIAYEPVGASTPSGWWDAAAGVFATGGLASCNIYSCSTVCYTNCDVVQTGVNSTYQGLGDIATPIWWYGGYTRSVTPNYWWRIKGHVSHAYGAWHWFSGTPQNVYSQ